MRALFFLTTLLLPSQILAEGRSVYFTEDPVVQSGNNFHAIVENMEVDPVNGDCRAHTSFPDGEIESYIYDGYEIQKIGIVVNGVREYKTLSEAIEYAIMACWPDGTESVQSHK